MVKIIFARAVYLMHILVINPVNFIGLFHYLLGVVCVYKKLQFLGCLSSQYTFWLTI